jgi:hypothetical protein
MNIYQALDYINNINIGDLPCKDITSITYGYKIVNGIETEEPCITFGFLEKKMYIFNKLNKSNDILW